MVLTGSLLAQRLSLSPRVGFESAARASAVDRRAKRPTCLAQFVAMVICQLSPAQSLRKTSSGNAEARGRAAPQRGVRRRERASELRNLARSLRGVLERCRGLAREPKRSRFKTSSPRSTRL
ncbi:DUF4372 domain-containing protein [bacterium]|nr:DUF4372 domain-containing protein [bacterium]